MTQTTRHQRPRSHRARRRTPPGAPPGTLAPDPRAAASVLQVTAFGPTEMEEKAGTDLDALRSLIGRWPVVWVNIDGLGDVQLLREVSRILQIHPLAQEDIVHVYQRAKVEPYGPHLFMVCRMFHRRDGRFESEQLSFYLGAGYLVTAQEIPGDCLDPIRVRLRQGGPRLRAGGPDYLAYALLDAVIDAYFPFLEECGDRLEALEDEILLRPTFRTMREVHAVRRDLLLLRRAVWPLREALHGLIRDPHPLIRDETRTYLRDCLDHTAQLIDLVETYRELAADLTDAYLSSMSQRTNEVMRLLTVISTIFIPLTFLAGVWGMNFDTSASRWNMPELRWTWGYPVALSAMLLLGSLLLYLFHRRGWIGRPPAEDPDSAQSKDGRP